MNFLAHLWLAEQAGAALAGAVLGDIVRGSDLSAFPPALQASIRLHRRIDAATDVHPLVAATRGGFPQGRRRHAGILLDVLFDHALARRWPAYSGEPLEDFAQRAGLALAAESAWFEQAAGWTPQADRFAELLLSYREAAGVDHALRRIAGRMREPQRLIDASRDWAPHLPGIERDLPALLAALRALPP